MSQDIVMDVLSCEPSNLSCSSQTLMNDSSPIFSHVVENISMSKGECAFTSAGRPSASNSGLFNIGGGKMQERVAINIEDSVCIYIRLRYSTQWIAYRCTLFLWRHRNIASQYPSSCLARAELAYPISIQVVPESN